MANRINVCGHELYGTDDATDALRDYMQDMIDEMRSLQSGSWRSLESWPPSHNGPVVVMTPEPLNVFVMEGLADKPSDCLPPGTMWSEVPDDLL